MNDNWIVANLENAFSTWNDKMTEIWQLLTTSPQSFKGGAIWGVISGINGGLQAIGLGLLVLFFAMGIFKSTASFRDFQRPEYALKHFIRFCAVKVAITYAMDLSYVGVCMEGAVIVLSCIIFSAFASHSTPTIDTSITTVTMIWKYIGEVIFNMLVLVGLIKGADRIVKELFGIDDCKINKN